MVHESDSRMTELDRLRTEAAELGDALESAAERLETAGLCPDIRLVARLTGWEERLGELSEQIRATESVHDGEPEADVWSIDQLEHACRKQELSSRARELVTRVESLRHVDEPEFRPLVEARAEAGQWLTSLSSRNADAIGEAVAELEASPPAWLSLLQLVEQAETLSDDDWSRLDEAVSETYGRSLAIAAARGKLTGEPVAEVTEPDPEQLVVDRPIFPVAPPQDPAPAAVPPAEDLFSSDNVFADDDAPNPETDSGRIRLTGRSQSIETTPPKRQLKGHYEELPAAIVDSAIAAINAEGPEQRLEIDRLVVRLVLGERIGLAYHLALGNENEASPEHIPAWLLRAWSVSPHVMFPQGRLAADLTRSLSQYRPGTDDTATEEAIQYMVCACALRAALIAPSTRAAAILRSMPMRPGFSHLYNYCVRIATYGEQLGGVLPQAFKKETGTVNHDRRLADLQAEVSRWHHKFIAGRLEYEVAEQLFMRGHWSVRQTAARRDPQRVRRWMRWQAAQRAIDGVVAPLVQGQWEKLAESRRLLKVLRESDLLPGGQRHRQDPEGDRQIASLLQDVRSYVQQATAAAALMGRDQGPVLVPAIDEIRGEVCERHEPVLRELNEALAVAPSEDLQMGLSCLIRAIGQIRDLVDPATAVPDREPDLRHLLQGELLKVPTLMLDSDWEPQCSAAVLEEEILRSLTGPQPDWRMAFQLHCDQGNHSATQKLLSLDVWTETEHTEMTAVRRELLGWMEQSMLQELSRGMALLREAVARGAISGDDRVRYESCLSQLKHKVAGAVFSADDVELLTELQNELEQAVQRAADRSDADGEPADESLHASPEHVGEDAVASEAWVVDWIGEEDGS
ncbi:hypothetical protein Mal4_10910 [Maioricimonas rarisocia]|uniref:Uncharacterized protein n=1 Tax=Maioricimonas rarisocia TaxID=2528026 RepID=A0A517Z2V8_9PLAN|nr:hypothetical protein [Maioricimonas rarisocia]QDU36793.1 hypothetical protein Mal4_10910 [Maioricimonas rarisocia]